MTRTWEDNAREFGALIKQGKDPRLALLVACSVERDDGNGNRSERNTSGKVSARRFTELALGTTNPNRVLRHLDAWDRLAKAKDVPLAASLKPTDAETLVMSDEAITKFDRPTREPKDTKDKPAAEDPAAEDTEVIFDSSPDAHEHDDIIAIIEKVQPDLPTPKTKGQTSELAALQNDPDLMGEVWANTLSKTDGKPTASVIKGFVKELDDDCVTPKLTTTLASLHVLRDLMDETHSILAELTVSDLAHLSWSDLDKLHKYARDAHVVFRRLQELDRSKPTKSTARKMRAV